jgi:hypothetical protein
MKTSTWLGIRSTKPDAGLNKQVWSKGVLILGGALLGLLLLELLARLLPPPVSTAGLDNHGDLLICSPTLGWIGRPNYRGDYTREEFSHPLEFNAAGMYDTAHPPSDDTFRLLWLGDSFSQALQVAERETAHQQLEERLNEQDPGSSPKFEVISAGAMGWGTGQELLYYREQGRSYRPNLVLLLFFMGNDGQENLPGHALTVDGFNCFAPYFSLCADGRLDPDPWPYLPGLAPAWGDCSPGHKIVAAGLHPLKQHSYLFAQLEPLLLARQSRRVYGEEFGLPFAALYLPEESEELAYSWQVTEQLLAQLNREVRADGAELAVIIIPPREVVWFAQLEPAQLEQFYRDAPYFRQADLDRPNRRLAEFLRREGVLTLDLQPLLIAYIAQSAAQLYLPIDRHWTVEGNRVAAELIFAWLTEEGQTN